MHHTKSMVWFQMHESQKIKLSIYDLGFNLRETFYPENMQPVNLGWLRHDLYRFRVRGIDGSVEEKIILIGNR